MNNAAKACVLKTKKRTTALASVAAIFIAVTRQGGARGGGGGGGRGRGGKRGGGKLSGQGELREFAEPLGLRELSKPLQNLARLRYEYLEDPSVPQYV